MMGPSSRTVSWIKKREKHKKKKIQRGSREREPGEMELGSRWGSQRREAGGRGRLNKEGRGNNPSAEPSARGANHKCTERARDANMFFSLIPMVLLGDTNLLRWSLRIFSSTQWRVPETPCRTHYSGAPPNRRHPRRHLPFHPLSRASRQAPWSVFPVCSPANHETELRTSF